jgi:hypothetical protein
MVIGRLELTTSRIQNHFIKKHQQSIFTFHFEETQQNRILTFHFCNYIAVF